ncbi:hypothetical protein BEWA_025960 [Theileria equi strain WA]|uniref:IgA-specific serine endopeptidase n=1 Tax=Theileria equi strain WA TaxID=1537102 RepID=L0AVW9_THEEQ|nr:hypothetical protein BEWA_025960 [Theileria equi strain WA]AFZ79747.1 hypothetical protein BEWA_025960 [Theileria equi strain WA]|eukprot:XP_004829413.1 hypothetical protein BEWA_025960 [Theileria equi strain WA]
MVLVVLWTVCLVRLCHCGGDCKVDSTLFNVEETKEDYVKVLKLTPKGDKVTKVKYDEKDVWSAGFLNKSNLLEALMYFNDDQPTLAVINTKSTSGTESTVYRYHNGKKWQSDNVDGHKRKLEVLKEDYKPIGEPEENPPVSSTTLEQDTLNISRVDQSNLEYFEYTHDDNLTQLIVPKKGVSVQKIVRGSETVWTPEKGERFEYSKLYLDKDRKLGLILITSNFSSDIKYNYFAKNGTKWKCTLEYAEKMKALKVVPAGKTDMSIDLEKEETDECRVLDVELLNVPTRFHLPKPEYLVKEVKDDEDVLWTFDGPGRCTSCAVYSKNGNHLLSLFIKDGDKSDYKHFEKVDGKWSSIEKDDFNKKYKNMQVTASQTSADTTSIEPKEVTEENDQQSNEYAAGPVADPQESVDIPPESSPSTAAEPSPTEDTEQTAVSSSDPVDQQPIEVNELQESEPLQSTEDLQEVAYPSTQQVEGFEVPEDSKDDNPEVTPQDHSEEVPVEDPKPVAKDISEQSELTKPENEVSLEDSHPEETAETLTESSPSLGDADEGSTDDHVNVPPEELHDGTLESADLPEVSNDDDEGSPEGDEEPKASESASNTEEVVQEQPESEQTDDKVEESTEHSPSLGDNDDSGTEEPVEVTFPPAESNDKEEELVDLLALPDATNVEDVKLEEVLPETQDVESPVKHHGKESPVEDLPELSAVEDGPNPAPPITLDSVAPNETKLDVNTEMESEKIDHADTLDERLTEDRNETKTDDSTKAAETTEINPVTLDVLDISKEEEYKKKLDDMKRMETKQPSVDASDSTMVSPSEPLTDDKESPEASLESVSNEVKPEDSVEGQEKALPETQTDEENELKGEEAVSDVLEVHEYSKQEDTTEEYTPVEPKEEPASVSPFLSKVDSTLFDVEEAEEDVKILKLTPKIDKVTKVKYDEKQIWSGKVRIGKSSNLVEALIYFNEENPALAIISTDKNSKVYRYLDGSKWKNGKEGTHKSKLEALKNKYKHALPATLDLSNPDQSKVHIGDRSGNGLSQATYTPKDTSKITTVVDGEAQLWTASGYEKCLLVESYAKNTTKVIYLEVESSGTKSRYFEKLDGAWNELKKDQFYEKAKALIGESGKDISLNISHPNRLLCKSFDYTFAGNSMKLMVPNKGVSVSKLMNSTEEVYTLSSGEAFQYTKTYLNKDGNPELVLLVTKMSGASKEYYLELQNGKWVSCNDKDAKMRSLRDPADYISDFELDFSLANSTNECSIFEAELLGVTTKHFFPKPGHLVKKVKDGSGLLWSSSKPIYTSGTIGRHDGYFDDYCLSCIIYKHGTEEILEMIVVENSSRWYKFFEKNGEEWKGIVKTPFNEKLDDLRAVDPEVPQDNTEDQSENSTTHSDEQSGFDDSASQDVNQSSESNESPTEVATVEQEEQTPQESGSDHSEEQLQTEQATSDSQPDADTNEEPEVVPSEPATETLDLASPDDSKVDFSNGDDKRNVVEASEKGEESTPPLDIDGNTQTKSFENSTEWNDHSNERSLGQESHSLGSSELRGSRTSISSGIQNRRDSTASTISTTSTASTLSLDQTSGSATLKLTKPDDSIYQSFDYYHDDNHIKLVLPQDGVTVTKISESWFTIWTAKAGENEELAYAKVYLKSDGKLQFVRVWKRGSSGVTCMNYTTGRLYGWSEFNGNINEKINSLKIITEYKGNSVIDLKNEEDTNECRIFSVNFLGVPTRSYSPKPGYVVKEVRDGEVSLWKASEDKDERCLSCELYTKDGQKILYLSKRKYGKRDDASFEFSDGEWKSMTEGEFDRRFKAMVDGSSQEPTDSVDTGKVENEPLPSGEGEDANSITMPSDPVNNVKVEDNESEQISEESKGPETSPIQETEQSEGSMDVVSPESEQTGPSEQKSESTSEDIPEENAQETSPTNSHELEASEPTEDIPTEPEPKENALEQSPSEPAIEVKTLDLSAIDSSLDLVDDETRDGVHSKSYVLKGESFERISEDGAEVWTAEGGEKLLVLNIHSKGDLALLNICTKKDHKLTLGYFEKNGSEWKSLNEDEFDQKYGEMKET